MLLEFGKNSSRLETRTHSMNILRALFKHTQLGEIVLPYVGDGFTVAITGFSKPTWTERNSATLLFASLVTRAFGVQRSRDLDKISVKNKMTVRVFNQKFPKLQGFLLEQLASATISFDRSQNEEILYPILIILARLYAICLDEDPQCSLSCFVPHVRKCAQGRILRTRELSAKALATILYESEKVQVLKELLLELEVVSSNNHLHGLLMQIYQLVNDTMESERDLDIVNIIESSQWIILIKCPMNVALYMQLLVQLTMKPLDKKTNYICASLINDIDTILEKDVLTSNSLVLRAAYHLKLHLIVHVMNSPPDLKCTRIKEILFKSFTVENKEIQNFTLNFLIYLLDEDKNSVIMKSWDIPPEEISLANLFTQEMVQTIFNMMNEDYEALVTSLASYTSRNDLISSKAFAVLSHFPTALLKISPAFANNEILHLIEKNKDFCDNNLSCAALCCLKNLVQKDFIQNSRKFAKLLFEFSSQNYSISCRYIVALIITENINKMMAPEVDGKYFSK